MHGGEKHHPVIQQPGLHKECDLEVRVATALPQPGAVPVHRNAAADHEVDGLHLVHRDETALPHRSLMRGIFGSRCSQPVGIEHHEGLLTGKPRDGHVHTLALRQGFRAHR